MAVVDGDKKILGMISDRDLLRYFKPRQAGVWHLLAKVKNAFQQDVCQSGELQQCLLETTAGAVMATGLITVLEETPIEQAVGLMIDKEIKRLPVVDADGHFKGMISRDALLRTGFGA